MSLLEEPILFLKPPSAILDPDGHIIYPSSSRQVDYEGELAVVIWPFSASMFVTNLGSATLVLALSVIN